MCSAPLSSSLSSSRQKYAEELRAAGIDVSHSVESFDSDEADPAMREIKKLRATIAKMQQGGGTRQAAGVTTLRSEQRYSPSSTLALSRWLRSTATTKDETQEFVDEIASKIGKSPLASAIRQRVAQGKFVDIDKFFILRHNAIDLRVTKRSKSKLATQRARRRSSAQRKNPPVARNLRRCKLPSLSRERKELQPERATYRARNSPAHFNLQPLTFGR
jgi:hypothetical protein